MPHTRSTSSEEKFLKCEEPTCNNSFNDDFTSKYCLIHRCNQCRRQAYPIGNKCCGYHTCTIIECNQPVWHRGFCIAHASCKYLECTTLISEPPGSVPDFLGSYAEGNSCDKHRCKWNNCSTVRENNMRYCKEHLDDKYWAQ